MKELNNTKTKNDNKPVKLKSCESCMTLFNPAEDFDLDFVDDPSLCLDCHTSGVITQSYYCKKWLNQMIG